MKNKEVEELARKLCEVCCYPAPNSWEEDDKKVWRYRASIILDKGWRKSPSVPDDKEFIKNVSISSDEFKKHYEALDKKWIRDCLRERIDPDLEVSVDYVIDLICSHFGTKPSVSVEEIFETIMKSTLSDSCVLEAYHGDVRELAQAIHDLINQGIKT